MCELERINSKNLDIFVMHIKIQNVFPTDQNVHDPMRMHYQNGIKRKEYILTVIQRKPDRSQFLRANFQPYSLGLPMNLLMSAPAKYQK